MASLAGHRKISAEEFIEFDLGPDAHFELEDGAIYAITADRRLIRVFKRILCDTSDQSCAGPGVAPTAPTCRSRHWLTPSASPI